MHNASPSLWPTTTLPPPPPAKGRRRRDQTRGLVRATLLFLPRFLGGSFLAGCPLTRWQEESDLCLDKSGEGTFSDGTGMGIRPDQQRSGDKQKKSSFLFLSLYFLEKSLTILNRYASAFSCSFLESLTPLNSLFPLLLFDLFSRYVSRSFRCYLRFSFHTANTANSRHVCMAFQ